MAMNPFDPLNDHRKHEIVPMTGMKPNITIDAHSLRKSFELLKQKMKSMNHQQFDAIREQMLGNYKSGMIPQIVMGVDPDGGVEFEILAEVEPTPQTNSQQDDNQMPRRSRKETAKLILHFLNARSRSAETSDILKMLGEGTQRNTTLKLLHELKDKGFVTSSGIGKFRWSLLRSSNWEEKFGGYVPNEEPEDEDEEEVNAEENSDLQAEIQRLRRRLTALEENQPRRVEIVLKQHDKEDVELDEEVHPVFEQVMFHVNCGDNVMLVGPKGCGKTFLAEQIANALDREFGMLSLSGGITEAKLFGRVTPDLQTGKSNYNPAPFVELYEDGGVFLLDEVDAADPNVLLSINSALANGCMALDRLKNPVAKRSKEFVCIAAANTWGSGADRQYVGRNQQDSAFTERFVQIEMSYDEALERRLCPGANELVDKMHQYRKKIEQNKLERALSTRFITRAYNWLQYGKDLDYVDKMLFAGWRADEVRKVKGGF